MNRRIFFTQALRLAALTAIPMALLARRALARAAHPEPRPGISAEKVLAADKVDRDAKDEFEMVRQIPQIVDGIRCPCGCDDRDGNYSLLSCYEGDGMAQHCGVCRGCARLAHRLHKDGKDLDEIRAAVDKRF